MPVQRNWTIIEQPLVVREDEPDDLTEAIYEAIAILRRVGGTIQIASQRVEIAPNVGVTESYIFAYNSFTPITRRAGAEAELEHDEVGDFPGATDVAAGDELTADEIEQHFPQGPLEDAIADVASAEQPAHPEPAAAME